MHTRRAVKIDLHFVSQGRVRTAVRKDGQFCCSFVANLFQYLCAKNYENFVRFDKVIAKIIRVQFLASHCGTKRYDSIPTGTLSMRERMQR